MPVMIRQRLLLPLRMPHRVFTIIVVAVIVLAVIQRGIGISPYYLHFASGMLIFGIMALGYNLLHGYTGLVSLGSAGFYAVGAYGGALMMDFLGSYDVWGGLLGCLGASALFALIVGVVSTRLGGVSFLLITFAFSMVPYLLIRSPLRDITGGHTGWRLPVTPPFVFDLTDPFLFLFFTLGALVAIYIILSVIVNSPFGLSLLCIKENELKLCSLGYNTWLRKTLAATISGTVIGFAGYLKLLCDFSISAEMGFYYTSAKVILCALIGGTGTLVGPFLGVITWFLIEEFLVTPGLLEIIMGSTLVVVVLRFPFGISGAFRKGRV